MAEVAVFLLLIYQTTGKFSAGYLTRVLLALITFLIIGFSLTERQWHFLFQFMLLFIINGIAIISRAYADTGTGFVT